VEETKKGRKTNSSKHIEEAKTGTNLEFETCKFGIWEQIPSGGKQSGSTPGVSTLLEA
jgi:hypothetical protein